MKFAIDTQGTALAVLAGVSILISAGLAEAGDGPPKSAPDDPQAGLSAADPAAGERVWRQCRACHAIEPGRHGVGPSLHGIVGAAVAAQDWGRAYSPALRELAAGGAIWNVETLSTFLENPRATAPGTNMAYAGLRNPEDRLNLIAWLAAQTE